MIRNNVTGTDILPPVANNTSHNGAHTNHINQDCMIYDDDGKVELVKINSSVYDEPSDSDEYESYLNEASNFINDVRCKNLTHKNDDRNAKAHIDPYIQYRRQSFSSTYRPNVMNTTFDKRARDERKLVRDHFFNTINDFLVELENSSDDERPHKIKQNYFINKDAQYENVNVFDESVYVQEGPTFVYSFKNKNCIPDTNENLINSPNKESANTSTDSNSVKKFNECTVTYEKNFFCVPKSFPHVIIPRLPLTYMLPTVTEIIEPFRQSPEVTEIYEEDFNVTRKPNNSWVMHNDDSSTSEGNNTLETNVENSADEFSLNNTKETVHLQNNTVIVHRQNNSTEYVNEKDQMNNDAINKVQSHSNFGKKMATPSPKSTRSRTNIFVNTYVEDNRRSHNELLNKTESVCKENFGNYSIKSRDRNSTPNPSKDFSSSVNSIPTLHLSFNTEIDTTEESWFKRFIKCILCCK